MVADQSELLAKVTGSVTPYSKLAEPDSMPKPYSPPEPDPSAMQLHESKTSEGGWCSGMMNADEYEL